MWKSPTNIVIANFPSKSMILWLMKKFSSTGSVLHKKKNGNSVLTDKKFDYIGALLYICTYIKKTTHEGTKLLKLRP